MSRTLQFRRLGTATLANTIGANGELIINTTNKTLTVHDGTTPGGFVLLNEATEMDIDQYARNTANTNSNNITILQIVNGIQNTNIISINSFAQDAYNKANAAYEFTQNDSFARQTANAAFDKANSANVLAQAAFNSANTSNVSVSFSATTILEVTNNGSSSYRFGQYGVLDNPNVTTFSATTLGFNLNSLAGSHPFHIRLGDNSADFSNGLVHISTTGTLSYNSDAQGKTSGTLFWRIPHTSVGNYKYRCSAHPSTMIGEINIANTANIYFAYNT